MFIHPFPKCSACFANILFVALGQVIRYMTLLISQVMCFGKSCGLNDLCVKLHFTIANFLSIGQ